VAAFDADRRQEVGMSDHGYVPYTRGCRCDVCRQAKADYMRARRAAARELARKYTDVRPHSDVWADDAKRHYAQVDRHGTRYAYEEAGCRCLDCTEVRTVSDRNYRTRKPA